jgi:hypothetical protein
MRDQLILRREGVSETTPMTYYLRAKYVHEDHVRCVAS